MNDGRNRQYNIPLSYEVQNNKNNDNGLHSHQRLQQRHTYKRLNINDVNNGRGYLEAVSATVDLRVFSLMASMKVSRARAWSRTTSEARKGERKTRSTGCSRVRRFGA